MLDLWEILFQDFEESNGIEEVSVLIRDRQMEENLRYIYIFLTRSAILCLLAVICDQMLAFVSSGCVMRIFYYLVKPEHHQENGNLSKDSPMFSSIVN